jgi:hypothetical protein
MRQKYKGEDIKARLHHTIIRYDNVPYMCDVDSAGSIGLMDLATGSSVGRVLSDDPKLDISSINIGFVNVIHPNYKCAVYLKREPFRKFKQGIELHSLTQKVLHNGVTTVDHSVLSSKQFVDAVLGKFPSYKDALDLLTKKGFQSVAISRDVALKKEDELLKVYLKDTEVGFIKLSLNLTKVFVPRTEQSYYHMVLLEDIKGWDVVEGVR